MTPHHSSPSPGNWRGQRARGRRAVNILAVCRGAPGLGRVAPALALTAAIAATREVTVTWASYRAGARFLAGLGRDVTDLGSPDGLFIDSVAPQALRVVDLARDADLVVIDGEFFLPVTLAHLDVRSSTWPTRTTWKDLRTPSGGSTGGCWATATR